MTHGMMNKNGTELAYHKLLLDFPPRTIKTEVDYAEVQAQVDKLIDKGDLSTAEEEYLDLLGTLIYSYEEQTEQKENYELRGIALLKGLMELYSLQQKDLTQIFKTESITSEILNGKRRLTTEHIDGLAGFFDMPHSYFFEPNTDRLKRIGKVWRDLDAGKGIPDEDATVILQADGLL